MYYYQKNNLKPVKEKLEPLDLLNFNKPDANNKSINTDLVMGKTIRILDDSDDKEQSNLQFPNMSLGSLHIQKEMSGKINSMQVKEQQERMSLRDQFKYETR